MFNLKINLYFFDINLTRNFLIQQACENDTFSKLRTANLYRFNNNMNMNIIIVFFDNRGSEIEFSVARPMSAELINLLNLDLNVAL